MKKLLIIALIAGLGFASCRKESVDDHVDETETNNEQTLILNGKEYSVNFVKRGLAKLLGVPVNDLIYDAQRQVFGHVEFAVTLDPAEYISDIETIKREGYEF